MQRFVERGPESKPVVGRQPNFDTLSQASAQNPAQNAAPKSGKSRPLPRTATESTTKTPLTNPPPQKKEKARLEA